MVVTSERHAPPSNAEPNASRGAVARRAFVAAWVCPETERLGREVGFPLAVLAATTDPDRHAARLTKTMYAAWSPRSYDQWPLPFDERYAMPRDVDYRQLRFDARWLGPTPLPRSVGLEAGALCVDLPEGASADDLGVVLRSGLAESSYESVARRPSQIRLRYFTQRPVVIAPRYALIRPGDIERVVPADDLIRFRPTDLAMVASVVALSIGTLALASTIGRANTGDMGDGRHG